MPVKIPDGTKIIPKPISTRFPFPPRGTISAKPTRLVVLPKYEIPPWCGLPPKGHYDGCGGCWGITMGHVATEGSSYCHKCEYYSPTLVQNSPSKKTKFKELWGGGALGNKLRSWNSLEELFESDYDGPVTIRCQTAGSPLYQYYVPQHRVGTVMSEMASTENDEPTFYFNESAPDDYLTIQGEIGRLAYANNPGWQLHYSTAKLPMRKALAEEGHQADGVVALSLLKQYCNSKSYQMLMDLFDTYDQQAASHLNCIIEFSCYSRKLGVMPNHNTIIWEVRNY